MCYFKIAIINVILKASKVVIAELRNIVQSGLFQKEKNIVDDYHSSLEIMQIASCCYNADTFIGLSLNKLIAFGHSTFVAQY